VRRRNIVHSAPYRQYWSTQCPYFINGGPSHRALKTGCLISLGIISLFKEINVKSHSQALYKTAKYGLLQPAVVQRKMMFWRKPRKHQIILHICGFLWSSVREIPNRFHTFTEQ
jgi:hypothetical protein